MPPDGPSTGGESLGKLDGDRVLDPLFDTVNFGPARTVMQPSRQFIHRGDRAERQHFYASVVEIHSMASDAEPIGLGGRAAAKEHALDAAGYEKSLTDQVRAQRVRPAAASCAFRVVSSASNATSFALIALRFACQ